MVAIGRGRRGAFVHTSVAGLAGAALLVVGWPFLPLGHRIRVVAPEFVRSAALPPDVLRACIRAHGIRCVISLRRKGSNDAAARGEPIVCAEEGVEYVQLPMNTTSMPNPDTMRRLVHRLIDGPRPVLVHCDHGVDRSGLASVLWDVCVDGEELERARAEELSWKRGHVGVWQGAWVDRFFDLYARDPHGTSLARWIDDVYPEFVTGRTSTTLVASGRGTRAVATERR